MIRVWSILFLACLFGGGAPALADVAGPACVTSGDELMINGKRAYGRCRGGTAVRLFGIVAPELDETCGAAGGHPWQCGRVSAAMLLEAVKSETVICGGSSRDADGRLIGQCRVRGEDLNRKMVRAGWALSYPRHSTKYADDEKWAMQSHKGLWQTPGKPSFEWRNKK